MSAIGLVGAPRKYINMALEKDGSGAGGGDVLAVVAFLIFN